MTVLSILHDSRRGANHLKLSAHFLNLLGLLLERCGQGLNLIFLQSNPCGLLFSRSLQLLHDLTLFDAPLSAREDCQQRRCRVGRFHLQQPCHR